MDRLPDVMKHRSSVFEEVDVWAVVGDWPVTELWSNQHKMKIYMWRLSMKGTVLRAR
ncbi:hypothetical protein [Murdochiella vaginalis]|uniref:hypothetical protein n=1 Tax=Murdochiella vaginalis TaxID=1852373 RepID=UPI000A54432D|nr:hypothetical protein [Murdochiella vaginalis]